MVVSANKSTKEIRAAAKFASVWKRGMSRADMIAALKTNDTSNE